MQSLSRKTTQVRNGEVTDTTIEKSIVIILLGCALDSGMSQGRL